jgi:hypothetical protein
MKALRAVLVVGALAVAGCGGGDASTEDAHDLKQRCRAALETTACLDDSQKRTIAFPNHFRNVATSCDGYGHRIWETTEGKTWIYPDPSCPGYTDKTAQGISIVLGQ